MIETSLGFLSDPEILGFLAVGAGVVYFAEYGDPMLSLLCLGGLAFFTFKVDFFLTTALNVIGGIRGILMEWLAFLG
ncbi:TPA: hypothetical protein HA318_04280 [Candidatus Micrarchaeota archaeon]|nr:MAG: hypothetical protein AUJ65_01725 [Candidatus Micrarchaeota archaeon CG1_02_51_15]HII39189.1 hypothetical protein [Candidatus Micrarchaeota archaeon]